MRNRGSLSFDAVVPSIGVTELGNRTLIDCLTPESINLWSAQEKEIQNHAGKN